MVHLWVLQRILQKHWLYGIESSGEIEEHESHRASMLYHVRERVPSRWKMMASSTAGELGSFDGLDKDQPLQGLHQVLCQCQQPAACSWTAETVQLLVLFTRPTNICFIAYTTIILEEVFQSFTRGNSSTKRYNSAYNIVHPSRHPHVEWGFVVL